jgi:signal transduction histidine kinase
LALALIYVLAARLGLAMDAVAGFATLVWPPSGIALAAILLFGYGMWPVIAIAAVVANLLTGAPPLVALGIGMGNTLEAVLGAHLLLRVPGFRKSLDRVVDVFALIGLAAIASTLVSATIGVASLYLGGIVRGALVLEAWRAWWVGDFVGDLIVASFVLVWVTPPHERLTPARWAEAVAVAIAVVFVGVVTFLSPTNMLPGAIFPVLIWSALRFGPRGAATTALAVSSMAIWGTVTGVGPFAQPQLREGLLALQTFVSMLTATFLVLAAAMEERRAAEREAQRARAAAEDANRAKSEFLAVMSHELRTPLNAIAGYVELLALSTQGPLTDNQKDSLTRIQRNQQHLLALINDVLSFARMEAGRITPHPVSVRVSDAIRDVEPLIQPDLQKKQIKLEREAGDDSLVASADPEQLQQILLNLLANAVKFTDPGGRVAIGADATDGRVRIWVQDSGIGIPPEQLVSVFEAFFQVDRGTKRRYEGIGLGLTIARNLARAMRGDVTIESRVGEGTRATVELPTA